MHQVQDDFYNQVGRGATQVPRPKSELTKNGKTIGVRLTPSEYEEYVKLGKSKWVRKLLRESRNKKVQNDRTN